MTYLIKVKFKAKQRLFNIITINRTMTIKADVEPKNVCDTSFDGIDDIKQLISEYSDYKKLSDPKLLSYTRYI